MEQSLDEIMKTPFLWSSGYKTESHISPDNAEKALFEM